jgi:hypothetical protein
LNSGSAGGISAVRSLACAAAFAFGAEKACGGSRRLDSLGVDMVEQRAMGGRGFIRPGPSTPSRHLPSAASSAPLASPH